MLISVLGFGSIWTRRTSHLDRVHQPDAAYYNTTGVLVSRRIRNRPRVYGVARFNGNSGFRPDLAHKMFYKVFDCEPPCIWEGRNKLLFKTLLARPSKPDAFLVTITADQSGGVDKNQDGAWLHSGVHLISFSECHEQQELMLVMPPFTWIRGRLGTFFVEPESWKPWRARLVLSAAV